VDDEVINLFNFEILFKKQYRVKTAKDAEEALALIETEDYDVLLTDQRMPGMTGVELCRIFKEGGQEQRRCFVVTGLINDEALTEAAQRGEVDGIITKPYNKAMIENSIKNK
jgi:CheY-like chemotaxis protein